MKINNEFFVCLRFKFILPIINFYDYGYDLLYNLPLVTTPKRNYDEINLELGNGLNQIDWNIQANKISKETLNLKIKERPSLTVPEKIMELIN